MATQVTRQASLVQLKDSQDAHKENSATVFGVRGGDMETAGLFCSNLKKSRAMQRMALFLNAERERLTDVIVVDCQGLWCGRLLMESTTVGRGEDAHNNVEQRWGSGIWDATLPWRAHILYLTNKCTCYSYSIFMYVL